VGLDGIGRHEERFGDLAVRGAPSQQLQDLVLAGADAEVAIASSFRSNSPAGSDPASRCPVQMPRATKKREIAPT
jgi:hypothetical protein